MHLILWRKPEFFIIIPVSHDPSEIILISWLVVKKHFVLLSMLKTIGMLNIFHGNCDTCPLLIIKKIFYNIKVLTVNLMHPYWKKYEFQKDLIDPKTFERKCTLLTMKHWPTIVSFIMLVVTWHCSWPIFYLICIKKCAKDKSPTWAGIHGINGNLWNKGFGFCYYTI